MIRFMDVVILTCIFGALAYFAVDRFGLWALVIVAPLSYYISYRYAKYVHKGEN